MIEEKNKQNIGKWEVKASAVQNKATKGKRRENMIANKWNRWRKNKGENEYERRRGWKIREEREREIAGSLCNCQQIWSEKRKEDAREKQKADY